MIQKPNIIAVYLLATISLFLCNPIGAQEAGLVNWLGFEQLEDSLSQKRKKVIVYFYTDWCTYCRKMDKVVFTKPEVITELDEAYYAVKFNAESEEAINFDGKVFINDQMGKSRNPLHQIAQLLALRDGQFVAPTFVILDENFNVTARYFNYLDSKKLSKALK